MDQIRLLDRWIDVFLCRVAFYQSVGRIKIKKAWTFRDCFELSSFFLAFGMIVAVFLDVVSDAIFNFKIFQRVMMGVYGIFLELLIFRIITRRLVGKLGVAELSFLNLFSNPIINEKAVDASTVTFLVFLSFMAWAVAFGFIR